MFNVLGDISWIAVAVAAVSGIVMAGLWFAVVVAKPYAIALGREGQAPPPATVVSAVGPIVCQLVTLLTSAVLIETLDVTSVADAIAFGLIVGGGYLTAMAFQIAINPVVPRPLLYGAINAPYFVASSVVSAVILVTLG